MPEYQALTDEQFEKIAFKYNQQRDVYGFISILSLTRRASQYTCFKQIIKYVLDKANKYQNERQREQWQTILKEGKGGSNVGLLLNERFVNLPYILVPQLHESLPEDLKFTKKQDDIEDPREFDYQYLLVISKYTVENKKKGATENKQQKIEEKLYYRAEDELFLRSAEMQFSFKTVFRETMQDGTKMNITGGGPET